MNTLHTTTRINKLREQNVRVIDVITAAMRAKEEINKILASQVTLNQVNDITMEYNLDVSNHNFRKNIVDTDAQKTKANIHSDANAKKFLDKFNKYNGFSPCLSLTKKTLLFFLSNKQNENMPLTIERVLSKPKYEMHSRSVSVSEVPDQEIFLSFFSI